MTRPDVPTPPHNEAAADPVKAFPALFVHVFAGSRALPMWLVFAAAGFAALLAFGRGMTEDALPPPAANGSPTATPAANETPAPEKEEEVQEMYNHLSGAAQDLLSSKGWTERVRDGLGIWVSVREQSFRIIHGGRILLETRCSTAAKGPGSKVNSFQTPLGWHAVAEKIGEDAPRGQVFREKRPTKEIWKPGDPADEDLVLTRVLTLRGEEPGKNKGGDVDSYDRGIYIHGTNGEQDIGSAASHGCVRLTNDDIIAVYQMTPLNTPVLITQE
jgi:hypothetical protein